MSSENSTDQVGLYKTYNDSGSSHYATLEVYFNKQGIGGEYREVPAGTSKTYTLKATISGYDTSTSNGVNTSMYGDAAYLSNDYESASDAASDGNQDFVWSDFSYGNTSTTATTTIEWMNGYNVNGMIDTLSSSKAI